ncbi:MAG: hypothetical protein QOD06_1117 [Candidatus Binatota bacterium]|nr:hypothetical protein [Candidatus Binatota bacterium]
MRPATWKWLAVVGGALVFATESLAIYVPNPAGRWAGRHFFLAGDFQYNASKDLDDGARDADDTVGFFVRPGYTVAPNVIVYGRFGVQDADRLDTNFAWGFGGQGAYPIPDIPELAVGGAFDFLYWSSEDRRARDVDWVEFQFTPGVSYNVPRVPELTPYAGAMFDFIAGDANEGDPFGLVFGTNYDVTNRVRLDGQLRVISETGFLFSAGYMF